MLLGFLTSLISFLTISPVTLIADLSAFAGLVIVGTCDGKMRRAGWIIMAVAIVVIVADVVHGTVQLFS